MQAFFETVNQFLPLSAESKQALSAILQRMELPKGHVLVRAGTVCHYIYFIEKGLSRTYYLKEDKDVTDWISTENTFACSIVSFITRKPDRRIIELLEDSLLWAIHYQDIEQLYKNHHEIERFGRLVTSHGLVQMQQRFDELHFATAHERYKHLIETSPTIIQRVPLGMIASYLGITGETLSRIRAGFPSKKQI
ncbi:Crp/Fnr family transcriptional regulator [Rhodocytophaga rosea]|uniref:Crp/Fnr family transcriptional regulator n=1 Tax=Rhodocytophaga rosea TaxID=2704465 RepID=A0A6C0GMS9_9BACT|nr:Crp/Fnr family transcriptional regulator [Rhodocytophaga rosea]QHT68943.1 Crp/Fnr family transcriptional regulator [Rhodocytophaga rosea]